MKKEPVPFGGWMQYSDDTVAQAHDPVNHPKHYTSDPSGVEAIEITRHRNFNIGNAIKYLWRAEHKGNAVEDLGKADWYMRRLLLEAEA